MKIYYVTLIGIAMLGCNTASEASCKQTAQTGQYAGTQQATVAPNNCPSLPGLKTTRRVFANEVDTIRTCRIVGAPAAAKPADTFRLHAPNQNEHFRLSQIITSSAEVLNYKIQWGTEVFQNVQTELLWMNKDAFIRVTGEAQFKIGTEPAAIQMGDATIYCQPGSHVNVRYWRGDTALLVSALKGTIFFASNVGLMPINKGHKVTYNFKGKAGYAKCDSTVVSAWTEGSIDSERMTLAGAAEILGRWYNKRFVLRAKNPVPETALGWTYASYDFSESISMLERVFKVRCQQQGDIIVITDAGSAR